MVSEYMVILLQNRLFGIHTCCYCHCIVVDYEDDGESALSLDDVATISVCTRRLLLLGRVCVCMYIDRKISLSCPHVVSRCAARRQTPSIYLLFFTRHRNVPTVETRWTQPLRARWRNLSRTMTSQLVMMDDR